MLCAVCGTRTKVIDSRETSNGETRRRRECEACDTRVTTYERVSVVSAEVDRMRSVLKTIGGLVANLSQPEVERVDT